MIDDSVFVESGLSFRFPEDWVVFKYDEHRFYRYVSGSGLKGVDFIGIRGEELYLIEVKNYVERVSLDTYDPVENLLNKAKEEAGRYLRKLEDSLSLLNVIQQYYQRKWWYRKIYLPFLWKNVISSELSFWTKATTLKDRPECVTFLLWLELPGGDKDQRAAGIREYFKNELKGKIPKGVKFEIVYSAMNYQGITTTG